MCGSKFPGKPKQEKPLSKEEENKLYPSLAAKERRDAAIKKCKITEEADSKGGTFTTPETAPEVARVISSLASVSFSDDSRSISFQNNSNTGILAIVIGFGPKSGNICSWDTGAYKAVLACGQSYYNSGIGRGVYGTLPCDPAIKKFAQQKYCLIGVIPVFDSVNRGLAATMDDLGWCK
jgi:hypothetical protein